MWVLLLSWDTLRHKRVVWTNAIRQMLASLFLISMPAPLSLCSSESVDPFSDLLLRARFPCVYVLAFTRNPILEHTGPIYSRIWAMPNCFWLYYCSVGSENCEKAQSKTWDRTGRVLFNTDHIFPLHKPMGNVVYVRLLCYPNIIHF